MNNAIGFGDIRMTMLYLGMTSGFVLIAGGIGITILLYLATIGTMWVALGRTKWWKVLRLDALSGGALLLLFDIIYFGRGMADIDSNPDRFQFWLLLVIQLTLAILTAMIAVAALIAMSRLAVKTRETPALAAMGKVITATYSFTVARETDNIDELQIPILLIISSVLWTASCGYSVAIVIKNWRSDYTENENNVHSIVFPLLVHWVGAAVLVMLALVIRNNVWSDASVQPTSNIPQPGPEMGQHHQPGPVHHGDGAQYNQNPQQPHPQQQMPYGYPNQGQTQPQQEYVDYSANAPPPQYEGQALGSYGNQTGAPVANGQK